MVTAIIAFIFAALAIYGSGAEVAMWALLTIIIAGPALWAYLVTKKVITVPEITSTVKNG